MLSVDSQEQGPAVARLVAVLLAAAAAVAVTTPKTKTISTAKCCHRL